jgi:hypothetical protein
MIKKWKVCRQCENANKEKKCKYNITPNAKDGKRRRGTACFYFKKKGETNAAK